MKEPQYRQYLVVVLLLTLLFNKADNVVIGVLLQEIKIDLGLSDTKLGLLTGIAFSLFYSLVGIPLARLADRGNRVRIIAVATALQCIAVVLCGLVANFMQLLLVRIGVAVGEAGCVPPAHSLIADYYSRAERARAVSGYMLGYPLSAVVGYFLAGWLNELYGWRITFVLLGLPGIALAVLTWLTLREPRRDEFRAKDGHRTGGHAEPCLTEPQHTIVPADHVSLQEVWLTLWANTTFRHLLLCISIVYFFVFGIWQWQPAFFIRSYGLNTGELGTALALIYGLGGLVGTFWGGEWASRRAAFNERFQLKVMALVYCAFGIVSCCIYLVHNHVVAFGLLGVAVVGMATTNGPLFATIQSLVPDRMRATSIAILYLVANLIGLGLGPLAAGALSDVLRPQFGEDSLRYALLALCPGYLWAGWHLWQGSKSVTRDVELAQKHHRDLTGEHKDVERPARDLHEISVKVVHSKQTGYRNDAKRYS